VKLSVLFPETRSVRNVVARAQRAEELGFRGFFLGSAFGIDPITALAHTGTQTSRILLGTAVVPTWPRHPVVMAQQAATANAMCGGRFRLGVGPSHVMVMKMYGIEYERPVRHVREYLTVVKSLLASGSVSFEGDQYRVTGFLDVEDGGAPPVMLSALHEQMCRAAGAVADGVLPWLAPASYVADIIVPNVRDGAEQAGRDAPPVLAEIPCYLSTDPTAVHEAARRDLAIYARVPFYVDMLTRAGVPGAADAPTEGWSAVMIDAVVPYGDADGLAAHVQAYLDAGADEVVLSPFGCGADPDKNLEEALEVLGGIARR
jgi:5,10-methylenetetrahydromethanopterin reductase